MTITNTTYVISIALLITAIYQTQPKDYPLFNQTTLIIIITVIVRLLAWQNKAVFNRLIFYPPAVNSGQWDRFVTHGFIHADSMHLLFNMFTYTFLVVPLKAYTRSFCSVMAFCFSMYWLLLLR